MREARDRQLVKNAADPNQVKRAERIEKDRKAQFDADTVALLKLAEFRRWMGELLESDFDIFATSYDQSGSAMYFKEGQRVAGLKLRKLLEDADGDLYDLLEHERRNRRRLEERGNAAAHTSAAEQGGNNGS